MTDHIGMGSRLRLKPEWQGRLSYIGDGAGTVIGQTSNAWKIRFDRYPHAIHIAKACCEPARDAVTCNGEGRR